MRSLVAVGIVCAAAACSATEAAPRQERPPVTVAVEAAQVQDVPVELLAIGTVVPVQTVDVKARVDGVVERVLFREGSDVKEGDALFLLDRQPFLASLAQARAGAARDRAQAHNADLDAERYRVLVQRNLVARQEYDQRRAQARALRAAVAADEAQVRLAKLALGYTRIAAPISGRTGSALMTQGNLVKANDVALVTIRQLAPIYVAFSVPATLLGELRARMGGNLPVRAVPRGGAQAALGTLTFVDNMVDPTTGTIALRATFPNGDHLLWPGQFADTTLRLLTIRNAIIVPARAVQTGQQGDIVFVVGADSRAQPRPVKVGTRAGDHVVVDGVRAGEQVVTDGQQGLVAGALVKIGAVP